MGGRTVNDTDRRRVLFETAVRLNILARRLKELHAGATATERMRALQGNLAAQRYDSPSVAGHRTVLDERGVPMPAVSDPTGEAAIGRVDLARRDAERFDKALGGLSGNLARLEAIVGRYGPPTAGSELAVDNTKAEPGCENCAQLRVAGRQRWEPVDSRRKGKTDVGEQLEQPMHLCVWCYDRTATWGRLPTTDELEAHHRGERVPWPKDVERPR